MLFISDPTLTTDNVAPVIELLNDFNSLSFGMVLIPHSQWNTIQSKYLTKREISNECASYYVHCRLQPSWMELARILYRVGEFSAVKQLKPFLLVRGKYQVIIYPGVNHVLKACAVSVFCHGLHNAQPEVV